MRRILYTRHDGGVSVCTPSPRCIRWMATGGRWNDMPHGFVEAQIGRQIAAGHRPDAAMRFARAMAFGGLAEYEALEVIRDRDCGHLGVAHELIDASELPGRWFRNAWRRSHNGGPVRIDVPLARNIHWQKLMGAVREEEAKREKDLYAKPLTVNLSLFRDKIRNAQDEDDLIRIWPEEVDR
jgi:hypothetical protein